MPPLDPRPAASRTAEQQRSLLIDVVKGMAILLVAFGHTLQGVTHRYGTENGWALRTDEYIYAFHMPAFFFVSGVFVLNSLRKRGVGRFMTNKLETVMYPYWLWSCVVFPWLPFVLGRFMNQKPTPWRTLALAPITGNLGWFLPSLFLALLVAALLRRVPLAVLFGLSWMVSLFWLYHCRTGVEILDRGLTMTPFLIAGMWIGPRAGTLVDALPRWQCGVLGAVCAVLVWMATPIGVQPIFWGFVPVGLLGTAMLLFLGRLVGGGALGRAFAWMGLASLAIYLFAPFGQVAGRALLEAMHVKNQTAHLVVGTAASVLPTAWLYGHRGKLRLGWAFAWPFRRA